VAIERTLR